MADRPLRTSGKRTDLLTRLSPRAIMVVRERGEYSNVEGYQYRLGAVGHRGVGGRHTAALARTRRSLPGPADSFPGLPHQVRPANGIQPF